MKLTRKKAGAIVGIGVVATGLALGVAVNATVAVDELRTESQTVGRAGAESARVEIELGVGELNLGGGAGANDLLAGDFTYNVDDWQPDLSYRHSGAEGILEVRQPDDDKVLLWWPDVENEWDLRLNGAVPTDLQVSLGVGDSDLRLGDLDLTGLDVETGVGETVIDLSGGWTRDLDARIESGVGELTVILPREVGVRIDADNGIGDMDTTGLERDGDSYVNAAYGESPVTLHLDIDGGVGEINLEVAP
jgi:hypothetical protein